MSSKGAKLKFEPVREAAFGSIAATYTQLGDEITHDIKILVLNNSTDVDVYFSLDGVSDDVRVASNSARTLDLRKNDIFMENGDKLFQKRVSTAPSLGAVWAEAIYT